jgi:hypothetical protein
MIVLVRRLPKPHRAITCFHLSRQTEAFYPQLAVISDQ